MDISAHDLLDSVLRVTGPRIVLSGLNEADCRDDIVRFVNAGGLPFQGRDLRITFEGDSCYQGGDVIGTEEIIREGGDYPSVYQTARYGNFSYSFDGLSPGEYFVDLHFAEIVNTNGPKGIRVFDVYLQDEKILSDLDVYAVVGAHKPLQLVDFTATLLEDSSIVIRFEGKRGIPAVCAICIRRAPQLSAPLLTSEHQICKKCATEMEFSPGLIRAPSMKIIAKYEKKIEELTMQCKLKSDECYEAWMSLAAANEQLERSTLELDNKYFQIDNLEQALEKQMESFRDVSGRYEHDKRMWVAAICDLEEKLKAIKQEHSQLRQDAHECANSIPDLNKMIFAVQTLVAQSEDLRMKYSEELAKRKKLFNQLQETKGNIRVFCRCRPLSKEDISCGYGLVVDFEAASDGDLGLLTTTGPTKKIFKFDRVYTPKDDQSHVYADASPMVTSVLDGYNVCIFAYGQTGTGKTFTMEGTEQNRGVNYRTLEELFKIAAERKETFSYSISVSVLEVYNEQIRDLLATSPSSKKLEVRQAAEGFHHVPGIVEAKVENIKEVWDVLQAGSNARAVGSNNVNEHSSRSHCMLCIVVTAKNLMNGDCTKSKLWLVDLAGSERLAKTDVQGDRLKEAQNINRSLSALGDVISALASKSIHIPYRNSKLTHLLQDSLGGDSKALMFVQISPSENDLAETLSSLNFASRVRGIELGPARKQVDTGELQKTKQMLDRVRQECRNKDEALRKLEENCQNLENKVRGKEQVCKSLQDKNKELEGQFEMKKTELVKGKEEACILLQQKMKELECKLKEKKQSETVVEQKVKELEFKLKERQQSESYHEKKVQELEFMLKEQESKLREQEHFKSLAEQKAKELEEKYQSELMLKQKMIKELEEKLRQSREQKDEQVKELEIKIKDKSQSEAMLEKKVQELESKLREAKSDTLSLTNSYDASRHTTPIARKSFRKDDENDPQILRTSSTMNRPATSHGTTLSRGTESFHEMKRKRDRSLSGRELENNIVTSTAEKMFPPESQRGRRLEQAKVAVRISRTPKANPPKVVQGRIIKEPAGGMKDRTRGWL